MFYYQKLLYSIRTIKYEFKWLIIQVCKQEKKIKLKNEKN